MVMDLDEIRKSRVHFLSSLEENVNSNCVCHVCPLCCKPNKIFYCKNCINRGDYFKSSLSSSESYADKHLRLLQLNKKKQEIELKCEKILQSHLLKVKLMSEIGESKERINLLNCLMKKSQEEISHKKTEIIQLKCDNNKSLVQTLPLYKAKVSRLQGYVIHQNNDLAGKRQKLTEVQNELKKVIRTRIEELISYIFPISVVQSSGSHDITGTVSALNEAATMAYMCGRWVTTDISGQLHHCIVAPILPASGDYSSYNDWVNASKEGVPITNIESVDQNQAYNISAALTYTTQLVSVIAFYLGIKLPNKLCYRELCCNVMSESKFSRRVSRLNLNVLHLCFSQNVRPDLLHPYRTLQNILELLHATDLGRIGPMEVETIVAKSLEDMLRNNLDTSSDESDSEEDNDQLPLEWETVPHVLYADVSSDSNVSNNAQSNSVASGLVNSAAASIVSIWRGLTNNR